MRDVLILVKSGVDRGDVRQSGQVITGKIGMKRRRLLLSGAAVLALSLGVAPNAGAATALTSTTSISSAGSYIVGSGVTLTGYVSVGAAVSAPSYVNVENDGNITNANYSAFTSFGNVNVFNNIGTLSAFEGFDNNGYTRYIYNTGMIHGTYYNGLTNGENIYYLYNYSSGVISSGYANALYNIGTISNIENYGTIHSNGSVVDIANGGTIGTLLNAQQGLRYSSNGGTLNNYVSYVTSASRYGTLIVQSSGLSLSSLTAKGSLTNGATYSGVINLNAGGSLVVNGQTISATPYTYTVNGVTYRLWETSATSNLYSLETSWDAAASSSSSSSGSSTWTSKGVSTGAARPIWGRL